MISAAEQSVSLITRQASGCEFAITREPEQSPIVAVIDLCCGMGGLALAAADLGLRVIAGVDVNQSALKTFSKNFPEAKAIKGSVSSKEVRKETGELFRLVKAAGQKTMVVSGPPCQGFSPAGSRDSADPRNRILLGVVRLISQLAPDCALIENVSTLLGDKHAERLRRLKRAALHGGFHVLHITLDASEFGVPQKRKRAFFLLTKDKLIEKEVLQQLETHKSTSKGAQEALLGLPNALVRPDHYEDERESGPVYNHFAMQHSRRVIKKIAAIKPGRGPMSYRRLHPTRLSNTLFSGHRAPPAHFNEPRSITVREAARLQGFRDDFRVYGAFSNQMEQVTNAVPPPLSKAVIRVLADMAGIRICGHG